MKIKQVSVGSTSRAPDSARQIGFPTGGSLQTAPDKRLHKNEDEYVDDSLEHFAMLEDTHKAEVKNHSSKILCKIIVPVVKPDEEYDNGSGEEPVEEYFERFSNVKKR